MAPPFKETCCRYLKQYRKKEGANTGWYHFICDPKCKLVGTSATAQVLMLIKECGLTVTFECAPMLQSLLNMQNEDGGWSCKSNILTSSTDPTALAVHALLLWKDQMGETAEKAIEKGIAWMLCHQKENGLWGPFDEPDESGCIYFSCVVLRCLSQLPDDTDEKLLSSVKRVVQAGRDALLNAFRDGKNGEDICGWGPRAGENVTLFHTAYTVLTLLETDASLREEYPVAMSLDFLSRYLCQEVVPQPETGEAEILWQTGRRMDYVHSVDEYVMLALLLYGRNEKNQALIEQKCKDFIKRAENKDWRYQGKPRSWRLYDLVTLCSQYDAMMNGKSRENMKRFKIAVTYAGESRDVVEPVVDILVQKLGAENILYDKYYEDEFVGPNLYARLEKYYRDDSELIVPFLCEKYADKRWCRLEWRVVQQILARCNESEDNRIMYVNACTGDIAKLDLPGFSDTLDGYIDAKTHTPQQLAELIIKRYEKRFPVSANK